jgi:hypothetical protein
VLDLAQVCGQNERIEERLLAVPAAGELHRLQADVPRDLWRTLSLEPQPLRIELDHERLLPLQR